MIVIDYDTMGQVQSYVRALDVPVSLAEKVKDRFCFVIPALVNIHLIVTTCQSTQPSKFVRIEDE